MLTGDKDVLDDVLRQLQELYPDVLVCGLKRDHTCHSHLMAIVNSQVDYVNVMTRGKNESRSFLQAMGELCSFHVPLDLAVIIDKVGLVTGLEKVALTKLLDAACYDFSMSRYRKASDGSGADSWVKPVFKVSLANITAHPAAPEIAAVIAIDVRLAKSYYPVHPAALDCLAQTLVLYLRSALTSFHANVAVPSYVDELYCRLPETHGMAIHVRATERRPNAYRGNLTAISDGQIAAQAKVLLLIMVDRKDTMAESRSGSSGARSCHGAVQLEWKPDVNLANVEELFSPSQILREDGGRWKVMKTVYSQLKNYATNAVTETLGRIIEANEALIRGTSDAFLDPNPTRNQPASARDRPAGTGGTTAMVLPALQSAHGEHMYLF
ncbi:hypothetical protein LX32DRAFT_693124 [Colletotrichum zoysiae]|uniref:Polyketide synthase dehydratase domain-containing protein n=1 Tax=Colletotrichum zoysiae TaxID=1216348 RepID=A0AAD9HK24_9PEZI|nr:hypothetical protein LX32DRAFT_693124 [Colletotrichum zoysiae]